MNKTQKKKISEIANIFKEVKEKLDLCRNSLCKIKDDENDKLCNLPESLRDGELGESISDGIDTLDSVLEYIDMATDGVLDATEELTLMY